MPTCPICHGRYDTWGGVSTHIWKKEDENHDMAESKDDATIWLAENDHITRDTSLDMSDPHDTDTSTDTSDDDMPSDTSDDPAPATADGGTVEFPANPDADMSNDSDPDTLECPGCDSVDVVDAAEVLRVQGANLSGEHQYLLRDSDHVCGDCGGVFDDE